MDTLQARERIESLRRELNRHNRLYYIDAKPEISDFQFDQMLKQLQDLEAAFPELDDENSPTRRVGGSITKNFETAAHRYPMLSLSNTYSEEEIKAFDERIQKTIGKTVAYVCELKFDGVAISLSYEQGQLTRAVTRGDGEKGDVVTSNVRTIRSVPLHIDKPIAPFFEIRGEVFFPAPAFEAINESRRKQELPVFANPRNTAAGTLKLQDSALVASRGLDCYLYSISGDNLALSTHWDGLNAARKMGFKISEHSKLCPDIQAVIEYIAHWDKQRSNLPFETDGVVIKVNDLQLQEQLGYTAKSPRWATAYKFMAEQALSRLISVSFQVGRTGAVTPVANLQPIVLAGTTVKRASIHNADFIRQMDLHLNDAVYVEKGGEIIPKIVGVDQAARAAGARRVDFVENCPACHTPLERKEGEAAYYCPNQAGCPPQQQGRIEHFISRKAMDIDGLGEGRIELLLEKGLIHDPADLYQLSYDQLIGLEKTYPATKLQKERTIRFREKTVDKLLKAIDESKNAPFHKVLYALGIRHVGETVARKLAEQFGSLDQLMQADLEVLTEIPEIGEKIAESVHHYFKQTTHLKMINRLKEAGLNFVSANEEKSVPSGQFMGKVIVVSGVFENYSREGIKERIRELGGKFSSSLSSKTDYLLAGSNMGPAKKLKAEQLGIPILTEAAFDQLADS